MIRHSFEIKPKNYHLDESFAIASSPVRRNPPRMDAGAIVEISRPEAFFPSSKNSRAKLYVAQIL
jgi:hypothetical protein